MRFYFSRIEQYVVVVLLLAILGALLVLSFAYGRRQRAAVAAPFLEQSGRAVVPAGAEAPENEVVVHVTGAVQHPGVYRFSSGARVDDAVRQAGGKTDDGYPDGLNLAARLVDGEQITVPTKAQWQKLAAEQQAPLVEAASPDPQPRAPVKVAGMAPPATEKTAKIPPTVQTVSLHSGPKPLPAKKVRLNSATEADLITLPGIGAGYAKRILDYRQQHGKFTDLAQLLAIPGIGQKTYEKIAPYIAL